MNGTFPRLCILGLAHNRLTGSLPTDWGTTTAMTKLNVLEASYNELTGVHMLTLNPTLEAIQSCKG